MMPGENQAKTAGVAPDGTAGTCQNCAVLNETLHEYMTSFLALKQKIIETDKILNEFKEKRDELQKTQRENAELHRHLDELLLSVAPFDSLHKDDVCMQEELQATKEFLKQCQDGSADLRNRNSEPQTLKERIIFQLKILQDSDLKQSTEVASLQNENKALEYKLQKTQEKLEKLEKELNKEKKSTEVQTERKELCCAVVQTDVPERSSIAMQTDFTYMTSVPVQTDPTEESLMDLRKIREYVAGLWRCVQPQSLSETPQLFGWCSLPLQLPACQVDVAVPKEHLCMSPVPVSPTAVPRTPLRTPARPTVKTPLKTPKGSSTKTPEGTSIRTSLQLTALSERSPSPAEEILDLFRWLPPLLSPIHSPIPQGRGVEEDLQLSEEEEEQELHTFKQEDVKEAKELLLSNGLKMSCQVGSPDSLPDVKFHQTSPTDAACPTTDRKGDALRLPVSINRTSESASKSPGERPERGEERVAIIGGDEVMQSEVVMGEAKPSPNVCGDPAADMEWDPSTVDGPSCQSQSSDPNRLEGPEAEPGVGCATNTHPTFGSADTNGMVLFEPKGDNAELSRSPLKNGFEPVNRTEMTACNGDLHREQASHLKHAMTDFTTLKPQDKDQIVEMRSKCTVKALESLEGSESVNGLVNGHDLDPSEPTSAASSAVELNGHGENHQDSKRSRIRTEQMPSPPKHIHHGGETTVREGKGQNGHRQTHIDVISSSDSSTEACGAHEEKPHKVACGDTESSEDLDYRTPRRKLRVAHSRRESKQPVGSVNGSSGPGETKETHSKGLTCSSEIQSPTRPVAVGGVVASSPDDTDLVTSTNKNKKQSHVVLGDALKNGFMENNPFADKSHVNMQAELDQETQGHSSGCMQNDDLCVSDADTPDRPGITNGTATAKHSAADVVHTNGTASLKQSPEGVVHTNGFGGTSSPTEDEGSYTRVSGPNEALRPVSTAPFMSPMESVHNIRSMMGPPLRPLLPPLMATPPKPGRLDHTPRALVGHAVSQERSEGAVTMPSANLALRNGPQKITFSPAVPTTPSPCKSVPSSPLQFGSATPKHALPVPCRHPVSALNPASPAGPAPSQENSMQMLDSMYPELSAQARTLNILRGNLVRPGPAPEPSTPPQATGSNTHGSSPGFNSVTTAFTKTQLAGKRCGSNVLLPKSAKKLRLGNSPVTVGTRPPSDVAVEPLSNGSMESKDLQNQTGSHVVKSDLMASGDNVASSKECIISQALTKLAASCFDLLVVVKSHVFIKRVSSVPVMRDEEKEVVSDFCTTHKALTEDLLSAILAQLKAEKMTMGGDRLQSLCRVYTALCRQNEDRLKANTLAYSLLKEDFPDAAKLLLFLVTTWPSLLTHKSGLSRAIQAVAHAQAQGDVLLCLSHYLHWDSKPCDIPQLINSAMTAVRTGEKMQFQRHSRHGDDLCPTSWEYIFTLDLLCAHQKWKWTHDNIIRNDLWPIMNAWVTQPRTQKGPIQDVTVAAVLRLIGRLGQQGIKEKYSTAVCKMAAVINMLGKQGQAEGVSWEVQLAAAYAIYDLSPSNPKEALAALGEWRGEATGPVPPAITSCLTQISSLCRKLSS